MSSISRTSARERAASAAVRTLLPNWLIHAVFSLAVAGLIGCAGGPASLSDPATSIGPTITSQPLNQTVDPGSTATFSVVASGTAPLSYQWQNAATGANIPGATSPTFLAPATTPNGSIFDVVISNPQGSIKSNTASLTFSAVQTITFGALANVTYGVAPIALTATASSGLPVSFAVTSGPATVSGSTLTVTGAGSVKVMATQAGDSNHAAATSEAQTFTSSRAVLTVTASDQSRVFGQANPTLTYSISGFVNGDAQSVLSGTPTLATTATVGSSTGPYPITVAAGTLSATNYTFTFVDGTLTVTGGVAQTITFGALANVTYGAAPITLTATASSGLPVSFAVTSGPATVAGSTLTVTGAGSLTVTATQAGDANHAAATSEAQTFTSSRAVLTVTAADQSRLFGQANPALTYTISGFVNGDTLAVISGTPTLTTTATLASSTGTYPISVSAGTLSAANYTFAFVDGALTVTGGVAQTITFGALANVTYGVAPITLTATASSGLPVSFAVTSGPATVSGSTLTVTGAGSVTLTATQAGDANHTAAAPVPQTFTSSPAVLTVTATDQSRLFGQANPVLTSAISGFVDGDTQSVVSGTPTLTTTATVGSSTGTYPITVGAGTLSAANYTFTFVSGTLTVTGGVAQTITFGALANVTYGVSPITLTAAASSGLPVSYSVTSGPAAISGNALTVMGAGSVTVTATQEGNATFQASTPVAQSFTSSPAVLTVTASNQSRLFGQTNPTLTYTISGFVNGDTQSVVSGTPTLTTTATVGTSTGTYPITVAAGTLSATNYTFTFVDGTLTVTAATGNTYSTSFASPPAPENPICENTGSGCNWIGGGAAGGFIWGDVQTVPGQAFGVSQPSGFGDPTAILTGTWGANQAAEGTVVITNGSAQIGSFHEVEVRLRMTIAENYISGYEAYCSIVTSNQYCSIARWNGPSGSFCNIETSHPVLNLNNGDVLKATATGTNPVIINLYVNGVLETSASDTGQATDDCPGGAGGPFTTGNPGFGFFDTADSNWSYFGFSSFSATDADFSGSAPAVVPAKAAKLAATDSATSAFSESAAPITSLTSTNIPFGSQYVGDTKTAPVVILTNIGRATLDIASIAVTGANAGDFVETNTCGSIASGSTCTINVAFTPSSTTAEAAAITITDNAAESTRTVTLNGTGIISAGQFVALSSDKTHLVNTFTGKPIYITGEQAYSLATNLSSNSDIELYLSTRESMGFKLISVRAADIANLVNYPDNALGQPPFDGADFTNLNEIYWEHLDDVIQRAAAHGITVLLNPAFVGSGPWGCTEATGWCPDLLNASDAALTAYGVRVGNRYKSYPNIVWLLGGDNDLADYPAMKTKTQDIANGIASVDSVHLMAIENECPYCSSQDDWAAGSWNISLLEHGALGMASAANADFTRTDYLPTFVGSDTSEGEDTSPSDVGERAEAYQAVLGGANLGSVFGNCVVAYFGYEYQNCSTWTSSTQWKTWLNTTGATGRMYLGNLMSSREFWKMVPDINHTVAVAGFGSGDTITATSRSSDGQTIIAYISNGKTLTVDMSEITSAIGTANCWWFNPSNGATNMIGAYANSGTQIFTPPDSGDWVLVIDDANASLAVPGTRN